MHIRTKLVLAFSAMAVFVPLVGGFALRGMRSIDGEQERLSRDAIPVLLAVQELKGLQQEQQRAVLTYEVTGNDADRQQYTTAAATFDERMAALAARPTGTGAPITAAADRLATERSRFSAAAAQLVGARTAADRTFAEMQVKQIDIKEELNTIRARFTPAAGGPAAEPVVITPALRNQINDLLLANEGMLHMASLEFALITTYLAAPSDDLRRQFDAAGTTFQNWLALANRAGGPEDKVILGRVQTRFGEFESSARATLRATDFAARSRTTFTNASAGIVGVLDEVGAHVAGNADAARASAAGTAGHAANLMLLITALACLLAAVLGFGLAQAITRPVVALRNVADRVSTGNLDDVEVDVDTPDEVGDLARALRRMVASVRFLMVGGTAAVEPDADDGLLDGRLAS